ncbi:MAG: hypothetical protein IIT65_04270 [Lachnospiraceae bacterium]|nr:hypothetical protein [Lachnospiraceae bacterium]
MEQYIKRLTDLGKQLRAILEQVSANKNNPEILNGLKTKTQSIVNEINGMANQIKSKLKVAGESFGLSQEEIGEMLSQGSKYVEQKEGALKKFGTYVDSKITSGLKTALWLVTSPLRGIYNITKWTFIAGTLTILGVIIGKTYLKSKKDSDAKRAYDGTGGLEEYSPKRLCIYDSPAYEYFLQTV